MKLKHSLDAAQEIPEADLHDIEPGKTIDVPASLGRRLLAVRGWEAVRPARERKPKSGANTEPKKEKP